MGWSQPSLGLRPGGGGLAAGLTVCCVQVPFFLFVVFVVYTLLPFSTRGAVVAGLVSSISHLLVLGALTGAFTRPSIRVGLQVRGEGGGVGTGLAKASGRAVVGAEGGQGTSV